MAFSAFQSADDGWKARQLAMLKAVAAIESGESAPCSTCGSWQARLRTEQRQNYDEIAHLRGAVQTLMNQLAHHMLGSELRALVQSLNLDRRLFNIPGENMYKCTIAPVAVRAATGDDSVKHVMEERVRASQELSQLSQELEDTRKACESAEQQLATRKTEAADQQRRLAKAEAGLRAWEASEERNIMSPTLKHGARISPAGAARENVFGRSPSQATQRIPELSEGCPTSAMRQDLGMREAQEAGRESAKQGPSRRGSSSRSVPSSSKSRRRPFADDIDFSLPDCLLPPRLHDLPPLAVKLSMNGVASVPGFGGSSKLRFESPAMGKRTPIVKDDLRLRRELSWSDVPL